MLATPIEVVALLRVMMTLRYGFSSLVLGMVGLLGVTAVGCSDSKSDGDGGGKAGQQASGGEAQGGEGTDAGAKPGMGGSETIEGGGGAGGTEPTELGGAGGTPNPNPNDSEFEVLPVPDTATNGFPLAFNDLDQVLVAGAVNGFAYDTLFVVEKGASSLAPVGDYTVSLSGLTVYACINNEGQIGFNGQNMGVHQVAFFDGQNVVPVDFNENDGALVLRTCNDSGTVVATTATGTESWSWKDGTAAPVVQNVFAVTPVGMNSDGEIAFTGSYFTGEEMVANPEGFITSAGPTETGLVAGMIVDYGAGTFTPATWKVGDEAATPLTGVPEVKDITIAGISDHGVVLIAGTKNESRIWLLVDGTATELGAEGYTLGRVVDVNTLGEILVVASANDDTAISGLILRP